MTVDQAKAAWNDAARALMDYPKIAVGEFGVWLAERQALVARCTEAAAIWAAKA